MVSGLLDFREFGKLSCPSLTAEEMREIAEAAHGEGFAVMAHTNGADAVKAAVAAGIDSIEHGYFMDDAAIADVAASDTIWVPTLAATAGFIDRPGTGEGVAAAIVADQIEKLARAAALGAKIASGSDAGAFGVPHATALDQELALLSFLSAEDVDAANAELRRRFRRG
jgi:imidazolonepropionase-like amidohydrolase